MTVAAPDPDGARLRRLADDTLDLVRRAAPVEATLDGDHRFDGLLPDRTTAGSSAMRSRAAALRAATDERDPDRLTLDARVTRDVVAHVLDGMIGEHDARFVEFAAGPAISGGAIGDAATSLLASLPKLTIRTPAHARDHLDRLRAVPAYLRAAAGRLRDGRDAGRAPVARLVRATIGQIDRYLGASRDVLRADPPPNWSGAHQWQSHVDEILVDQVHPALRTYRETLVRDILPHARSDDRAGLAYLPQGAASYAAAVRQHTTTAHTADHWHHVGLDGIAQLTDEYARLGQAVLGTANRDDIFARLRADPHLRFAEPAAIVATAVAALDRAQRALPAWIDAAPTAPCAVVEIPPLEAPDSTLAYYVPPALDGDRPGRYYVNTHAPGTRTRFEAEALAFHESVPGHHTQHAVALALDLTDLQRTTYITPFAEGWALYTERLADEMGLYSGDLQRLGMLSFDSWRACRLVVDTGLHHLGWSRDRAVQFMRTNSPQAHNNIDNEIDRYIGWPGQALSYMAGRAHIRALRSRAERTLGASFDLAAFHAVVLGHAAVPLWTLERVVHQWLAHTSN